MKAVEITYHYESENGSPRERPADADAALRRLDDGSRAFGDLFAGLDARPATARRVIRIDPRDLGLLPEGSGAPRQRPFAAVLGCSDARVPIELVFNEGPNDLFVVRVAGNTLGDDVRGSLKYALQHLGESLKVMVVLGHSGCGAVTAAVDVFLDSAGYLSLASQHSIRALVDRLQIVVQASAKKLQGMYGPDIAHHRGFRDALIEVSVVTNAALAAHTLQREFGGTSADDMRTAYGVYLLAERTVWAPRCGSDAVRGLATSPADGQAFVEFSDAVLHSERIARILSAGT
jgi:carbonic anhydrase